VTDDVDAIRARLARGDTTARDALIAAARAEPLESAALLGDVGAEWTIEPLAALARHPDTSIRNEAIIGLGRTNRVQAVPALLAALEDPDPERRDDARVSLVGLLGRDIVEHLAGDGADEAGEVDKARAWWSANEGRFPEDVAIYWGKPLSIETAVRELEASRPEVIRARLRMILNWVGAELTSSSPEARVKAMRRWWDANRDRFVEGRRYFQGHLL
jgi:hypothetical protein